MRCVHVSGLTLGRHKTGMTSDRTHPERRPIHFKDGRVTSGIRHVLNPQDPPPLTGQQRSSMAASLQEQADSDVTADTNRPAETSATGNGMDSKEVARQIFGALHAISAHCDGALSKDNVGFNQPDASFGNALDFYTTHGTADETEWNLDWPQETVWAAHEMLGKYKGQLEAFGVSYDTLPVPQAPAEVDRVAVRKRGRAVVLEPYRRHRDTEKKEQAKADRRQKKLEEELVSRVVSVGPDQFGNESLVISFKFNRQLVDAVKIEVPGVKYNPDQLTWHADLLQLDEVQAFAANHQFTLNVDVASIGGRVAGQLEEKRRVEAERLADPNWAKRENGTILVDPATGVIQIKTPQFDERKIRVIQKLPGRKWHPAEKINTVSPSVELLEFAEEHSLYLDPQIPALVEETLRHQREFAELTAATETDFEIPGFGVDLYGYQKAGVEAIVKMAEVDRPRAALFDDMGLGKGGTDDTKILTPTGWTTFAEVTVGEQVIGSDGKTCRVTGVFPRGILDVYRVTMSDGSSVLCDADHLWQVGAGGSGRQDDGCRVVSTRQLLAENVGGNLAGGEPCGDQPFFIPIVGTVEFEFKQELPLNPYLFGVLLAAVSFTTPAVSSVLVDHSLLGQIEKIVSEGTRFLGENFVLSDVTLAALQNMGLYGCRSKTKFVPECYLLASPGDRLALLQGLFDVDGQPGATVEFCTTSPRLVEGIEFLVRSLGGVTETAIQHLGFEADSNSDLFEYRIQIVMPEQMKPFTLPEKVEVWERLSERSPSRSIVSVVPEGKANITCISVDAPDHLYVTDDFIVTHNTTQSIGAIEALDAYPAVIVVPATLKRNWQREFNKAVPDRSVLIVDGVTPQDLSGVDVVVVNYDILGAHVDALKQLNPGGVVFDESHYVKNPQSKRTKAAFALTEGLSDEKLVLALSGTPVTNKTREFITQFQLIGRFNDLVRNEKEFLFKFCGPTQEQGYGYRTFWKFDGASNTEELQRMMREGSGETWVDSEGRQRRKVGWYIRRHKKDVLKDLPEKTQQATFVDLPDEAMKKYKKVEEDVATYVANKLIEQLRKEKGNQAKAEDVIAALSPDSKKYRDMGFTSQEEYLAWTRAKLRAIDGNSLTELTTLRKLAAELKLPVVKEWVGAFQQATDRKLIVFAHHKSVVDDLAETFEAPKISGSVKLQDRQEAVDRFQTDPNCKVIICNLQAASEGITLTAASDVLFAEQAWTPATMLQAEARAHRIGQTEQVTAHYLLAENTVDEHMYRMLEKKRRLVESATEGSIGEDDSTSLEELLGVLGIN